MKATRSPTDSLPAIASRPPYQRTTRTPAPPTMFITGPMNPRTRARRRFSSWKRALARAKLCTSCPARIGPVEADAGEWLLYAGRHRAAPLPDAERAPHEQPPRPRHDQEEGGGHRERPRRERG